MTELKLAYQDICKKAEHEFSAHFLEHTNSGGSERLETFFQQECLKQSSNLQQRLLQELLGLGPVQPLLEDQNVTEILINSPDSIWLEKSGQLKLHSDSFLSPHSYLNIVDRLANEAQQHLTVEKPYVEGHFKNSRLSIVGSHLTQSFPIVSIRKHPQIPRRLNDLFENKWGSQQEIDKLRELIKLGSNILVIGETGSGKTSVLNALLLETKSCERTVVIEDSSEIYLPNSASIKLLTRAAVEKQLIAITQQDLLKRALRLRPDRLVMGEIRGEESKDFLMMLASGHRGSLSTLHAKSPQEALIRLEMLIQLGAPEWSLQAIRRLIFLSLNHILVVKRMSDGQRRFAGLYRVNSLEDSGITFESEDRFTLSATSSEIV